MNAQAVSLRESWLKHVALTIGRQNRRYYHPQVAYQGMSQLKSRGLVSDTLLEVG
jgi:hypothetical protein